MARIIQQTKNSAHGWIDLIVEDAFGDLSHPKIHLSSIHSCAECGMPKLADGMVDVEATKNAILDMTCLVEQRKIEGFEKAGMDMSVERATREAQIAARVSPPTPPASGATSGIPSSSDSTSNG